MNILKNEQIQSKDLCYYQAHLLPELPYRVFNRLRVHSNDRIFFCCVAKP